MKTIMNLNHLDTIEALESFIQGNTNVAFCVLGDKNERYAFIQKTLIKFSYMTAPRINKGVIIQFLIKITGYSRQQLTRLIKQYKQTGYVRWAPAKGNGFKKTYTDKDIKQLLKMDDLHNKPCGHVIKKLCERSFVKFNDIEFETLSKISVSQIYNLRQSKTYKQQAQSFTKTKSKRSTIGTRQKPKPEGRPGYIRVDTVHQGDLGKQKGVYHVNAVDEVTQFEIVGSVEKISEQFLIPVLENMIESFPFTILGFHSDNGSEYINRRVEELLNKLLIEFTKSRPRHSNDNALAESKNAGQ